MDVEDVKKVYSLFLDEHRSTEFLQVAVVTCMSSLAMLNHHYHYRNISTSMCSPRTEHQMQVRQQQWIAHTQQQLMAWTQRNTCTVDGHVMRHTELYDL